MTIVPLHFATADFPRRGRRARPNSFDGTVPISWRKLQRSSKARLRQFPECRSDLNFREAVARRINAKTRKR